MNTILQQLGGNQFIAMTGAKNFVQDGNAMLQFDIPRGRKVRIELDATDTYTVKLYKWNARKLDLTLQNETSGVYNDQLPTIFSGMTGLFTNL